MKLLIVESPSKAKTINQYLGKDFLVLSSYGHIRSLPSEPGSVKPEENFSMIYEVNERAHKHINEITKQAKKCDALYLATDPDREGEAISWHVLEALKNNKALTKAIPIKRVVFHEITKKAVSDAINNPRELNLHLVQAQQARQALDYLVGFTLSPVLWRKLPGSRSAGRVQSVALRLICEREIEIEKFKPQEYWTIEGLFKDISNSSITAQFIKHLGKKLEKLSIGNEAQAKDIVSKIKDLKYTVSKVETKESTRSPQPPFTTSTMLQEASRKLNFSAKKTSKIAQDLYEGVEIKGDIVGLITYMRTDSVVISEDAILNARNFINTSFGNKYLPKAPRVYKTKTKNAQEAHEAIRPTNITITPEQIKNQLDIDHFKLYELIWKRTVASQMENAIIETLTVEISSENNLEVFKITGSKIKFDGYYTLYIEGTDEEEDKDKQILPNLNKGDSLNLDTLLPKQHFTQPPHRYTEATLVKGMEELGIGRPSTYPTIISILQDRAYVHVDKKRFIPDPKGMLVSAFLSNFFAKYVEYDFTAKLEDELDEISNGKIEWKNVLQSFWDPFKKRTEEVVHYKNSDIVQDIENSLAVYVFHGITESENHEHICPTCKTGKLGLKAGKFGAFVGCSNYPTCRFTKQIGHTNAENETSNNGSVEQQQFPKILGNEGNTEISLRKGPYGIYVQSTHDKDIKRVSLPKNVNIEKVDLNYARRLLTLPRVIGMHPEGGEVKAGIGRFGPYVEHNKLFHSLKGEDDPISVSLDRALELLEEAKNKPKKPRRTKKK